MALAGDDSTATDPRVVAGEFIFAEEAKLTRATLVGSNPNIVVASNAGIQQGYAIECIGVYKDIVATLGSYNVTVPDVAGLKIGQLMDESLTYFAYGTVITNIVGLTVTLSNPALGPATTEVLFRPVAPPLIVGSTVVIPSTLYPSLTTATTVTNIAGTTLTLSAAPTASMTKALVSFFPAELDPNVFDEAQLFT
ncbi:MAG: hypothetical protein EBY83_05860 [Verrucomicrobia bacterium]|nr:hypothetical protein [Verrucomicrobiota bacterium]